MHIGTTLRQLRIQKRISQSLLAELVGVSQATISNWESDNCLPNAHEIARLASVLDVSPAKFLPDSPPPATNTLLEENAWLRAQNTQLTQQLAASLSTISRQQELLAGYLQGGGSKTE